MHAYAYADSGDAPCNARVRADATGHVRLFRFNERHDMLAGCAPVLAFAPTPSFRDHGATPESLTASRIRYTSDPLPADGACRGIGIYPGEMS